MLTPADASLSPSAKTRLNTSLVEREISGGVPCSPRVAILT